MPKDKDDLLPDKIRWRIALPPNTKTHLFSRDAPKVKLVFIIRRAAATVSPLSRTMWTNMKRSPERVCVCVCVCVCVLDPETEPGQSSAPEKLTIMNVNPLCSQQSLVLISKLPYVTFFHSLLKIMAPEYFEKQEPCLEAGELGFPSPSGSKR